ncbi:MAG: tetratricopeptide repeat protein, partial [Pseudanabaena sp.]
NLAGLYSSQGKYAEAEPLYQQALALAQELLGDRHPHVAGSLFNLAALYYSTQRYSEALQSIQLAIQIYQQTIGNEHPTTQSALSWLQAIQNAM